MVFLFEIYLALLRILLLLLGVAITVVLGGEVLVRINDFLVNGAGLPCLEVLSFLALAVIPLAILYGVHHQKYFWQRRMHYNLVILVVCFIVGVIITLLPLDSALMVTSSHSSFTVSTLSCYPTNISWLSHAIGTALVSILFGFIGLDIGATLKHASKKIRSSRSTVAPASKKVRVTKKKRK